LGSREGERISAEIYKPRSKPRRSGGSCLLADVFRVGFAQLLQVNPAVAANPNLIQQGTGGGPALQAGDTSVIQSVMTALATVQNFHTAGLGPAASVANSGLPATATLDSYASQLIAAQANQLSVTQSQQTSESAYSSQLQQQLSNTTGVNLDTEMANMLQIQRVYSASAQVMKTVNQTFQDLITAVQ